MIAVTAALAGILALLVVTRPFAASVPRSTASPTTRSAPVTVAPVPSALRSLERATVIVAGRRLSVAVATTEREQTAGLQGVTDLGPLDGMLFTFPSPTDTRFWMKDTPIPLDIAFFDAAGRLVTSLTMPVCAADPCPTYAAAGPYVWALETPAGHLGRLPADAHLAVEPSPS